jgi:hypothetical protein
MKPRSELYWDIDTTRPSAPPGDAVEPKTVPSLQIRPLHRRSAGQRPHSTLPDLRHLSSRLKIAEQYKPWTWRMGNEAAHDC